MFSLKNKDKTKNQFKMNYSITPLPRPSIPAPTRKKEPGMCHRIVWKGTARSKVCNSARYRKEMCYYHWSKKYGILEERHGPGSRKRRR